MNGQFSSAFLLNTKDHHVPVVRDNNTTTFFINKWGGVKSIHLARRKDPWIPHEVTQNASDKQTTSGWFKTMVLEQVFSMFSKTDFTFSDEMVPFTCLETQNWERLDKAFIKTLFIQLCFFWEGSGGGSEGHMEYPGLDYLVLVSDLFLFKITNAMNQDGF